MRTPTALLVAAALAAGLLVAAGPGTRPAAAQEKGFFDKGFFYEQEYPPARLTWSGALPVWAPRVFEDHNVKRKPSRLSSSELRRSGTDWSLELSQRHWRNRRDFHYTRYVEGARFQPRAWWETGDRQGMYELCFDNPPAGASHDGYAVGGALEWRVDVKHSGKWFRTVEVIRPRPQAFEPGEQCLPGRFALDGEVRISAGPRHRGTVGVRNVWLRWRGLLPEHISFATARCIDEAPSLSELFLQTAFLEASTAFFFGVAKAFAAGYKIGRTAVRTIDAVEDSPSGRLYRASEFADMFLGLSERQAAAIRNCAESAVKTERSRTFQSIGGVYSGYVHDAAFLSTKRGFYRAESGAEFHLRRRPGASFIKARHSGPGYLPSEYTALYLPDGFFQCPSGDIRYKRTTSLSPPLRPPTEEEVCRSPQPQLPRLVGRYFSNGLVQCDTGEIRFVPFVEDIGGEVREHRGVCGLRTLSGSEETRLSKPPEPEPTLPPVDATPLPTIEPEPIPTLTATSQFTDISVGFNYSCGLKVDRTIACWGDNQYGQANPPSGTFTAISTGESHACAIRTDQAAVCWGSKTYGEADAPTGAFAHVSASGSNKSCGIRPNRTMECWGWLEARDGRFLAVSLGDVHACAVKDDRTIECWHHDTLNAPSGEFTAVDVDTYACGIRVNQTIACWGEGFGVPNQVPRGRFIDVATGVYIA